MQLKRDASFWQPWWFLERSPFDIVARMSRLSRSWPALLLLAACTEPRSSLSSWLGELAAPGPWQIPTAVYAAGDTQYVRYEGAGPYVGKEGCSGSLLSGTRLLGDHLRARFPQISLVGGYACRPIRGSSGTMSVHAIGRALDLHIPTSGDPADADNDLGDEVGHFLIEHAELLGIQLIIWDEWSWGASRAVGSKGKMYTGVNPHHDHLHVELSQKTASLTSDWFSAALDQPSMVDAGDIATIPDGSVLDGAVDVAPMSDGGTIPAPRHPQDEPVIEPVMEDDPLPDEDGTAMPEPLSPIQGETCSLSLRAGEAPRGLAGHALLLSGLCLAYRARRRRNRPRRPVS